MLNIRGMSTVDSLLGVMVHPAELALHCRTCLTVFFRWAAVLMQDPTPTLVGFENYSKLTPLTSVIRARTKGLELQPHRRAPLWQPQVQWRYLNSLSERKNVARR